MKFRRTPQERMDMALARLLWRDWKIDTPESMRIVECTKDGTDGSITIVASNRPLCGYWPDEGMGVA
jgi:hypothetical protein